MHEVATVPEVTAEAAAQPAAAERVRLQSVDLLRGVVMVVMATMVGGEICYERK